MLLPHLIVALYCNKGRNRLFQGRNDIMTYQPGSRPLEVELKLTFPAEARALIDQQSALQAAKPEEKHLLTTYYDTPALALYKSGLTLRMRQSGGQWVQTLKSRADGRGLAARRGEWEWPAAAGRPDFELLGGTLDGAKLDPEIAAKLVPMFITDIRRTSRRLELDGGTTVDVAVDEGSIRAGDAEEPVHELELELKEGPVGPLYRLALELHSDLPLLIGVEPKAARGYRLSTRQAPQAQKASEPKLDRHVAAVNGLRQIVAPALGDLLGNQPAAASGDAEGVHQMRVAIRRLRAALVLFDPHLELHAATRFEDELRRLGRVLGEARDWDVFYLETLPAALSGTSHESWRRLLDKAVEAERAASHRRLGNEFARPALTGLALGLAAWTEDEAGVLDGKAMHKRLSDLAPELLDRVAGKVIKGGRHIGRHSGKKLHTIRKSLKKLRYSVDYLAGLYSHKAVKSYLKRCKDLQELLGQINDAAMAVTLVKKLSHDRHLDLARAVGTLEKWSEKRHHKALRRLPDAWGEFRAASPFWK